MVWIAAIAEAKHPPNVMIIFADDWGKYASAYAQIEPGGISDCVSTPHFDRIAREGVLFKNAFVNAPSCTPCRSSLLSGQYFWRTGRGAILNGAVWDLKIPSFPLLMEGAGYHIGFSHKVWSPGTPADAPYGATRNAYVKAGRRFNSFSEVVTDAANPESAQQALLTEVRNNFQQFLQARPGEEPFCYWFGPTNCHRKWVKGSGKQIWSLDPDKLKGKLPPFLPDVPEIREDINDYLGEVQALDAAVGVLIGELEKIKQLDNTIVIISGDHGIPGFPRGKCNLYDFGTRVSLAIRWPEAFPGNRVLDDFVSLPDLAPTLVEVAGMQPPEVMTAKSLLPILKSEHSGQVDPDRDAVIIGRERHVGSARTDQLPYPQRAIHTQEFLLIKNFKPERWPMGTAAGFGLPDAPMPGFEDLQENTRSAFADMDASPTKAWLIEHRHEPSVAPLFELAFGLRPEIELYDLRVDPHHMKNLADDPAYSTTRKSLEQRLQRVLENSGDPRVVEPGTTFDLPPFTD